MGHHVHVFLYRGAIDRAAAAAIPHAHVCALPAGVTALAITYDAITALEDAPRVTTATPYPSGFIFLDAGLLARGEAVAAGAPFAYAETDYFGGVGDQRAAAWAAGSVIADGSINDALAALGVDAVPGTDRFETIGLDVLRSDDAFADGHAAGAFRIVGRRMIGRYTSPEGWLELRGEPPVLGAWRDGALVPWTILPGELGFADGARRYGCDFDRNGTPGLRDDRGVRWIYNDGPSLVHGAPAIQASLAALVGAYTRDGARALVRLDKGHAYLDDVRILVDGDAPVATARGVAVRATAAALELDGVRWTRA